jgi:hypothetical protein
MPFIEGGVVIDVDSALQTTLTNAGAPANGVVGTGTKAGIAEKGQLLIDTTNAKLYINTGTKASVTWTVVGAQT